MSAVYHPYIYICVRYLPPLPLLTSLHIYIGEVNSGHENFQLYPHIYQILRWFQIWPQIWVLPADIFEVRDMFGLWGHLPSSVGPFPWVSRPRSPTAEIFEFEKNKGIVRCATTPPTRHRRRRSLCRTHRAVRWSSQKRYAPKGPTL